MATIDELRASIAELNEQMADAIRVKELASWEITRAHEIAKETGFPADKTWLTAIHIKKTKVNLFINQLRKRLTKAKSELIAAERARSEAKKQEKAQRIAQSDERSAIYERQFIKYARQLLPRETYQMLIEETLKSMGEETEAAA